MTNQAPKSGDVSPTAALTLDSTMAEVLAADESLRMVLMRFHIGGCSMCGFEPNDSVRKVAEDNGVPPAELLGALRRIQA